jgi:hypothetical protein
VQLFGYGVGQQQGICSQAEWQVKQGKRREQPEYTG